MEILLWPNIAVVGFIGAAKLMTMDVFLAKPPPCAYIGGSVLIMRGMSALQGISVTGSPVLIVTRAEFL
jgi:hypothetical protein